MSVTYADPVRLRGCGNLCQPYDHDPFAHRRDGYEAGYAAGHIAGYERAKAELAPSVVRTGPLVVDLNARTATVNGEDVGLSGREWGVLAYLAGHVGQWCAHDEIVAAAWGPEWVSTARYSSGDRAHYRLLATTVDRLRKRLGPAARLVTSILKKNRCVRRLELEAPL